MKKSEKLLDAIGGIDEKYIAEASPFPNGKMKKKGLVKRIAGIAAAFVIGMLLFFPNGVITTVGLHSGSEYYPIMEAIDDYILLSERQNYTNGFDILVKLAKELLNFGKIMAPGDTGIMAPGDTGKPNEGADAAIATTDLQVEGVDEADIMKMTEEHIFYLSSGTLTVFSVAGEESKKLTVYNFPGEFQNRVSMIEMYLSEDGERITVIGEERGFDYRRLVVILLDVSDIKNIRIETSFSLDGLYNTSRMAGDRLIVVSEFQFNKSTLDYSDLSTFVPSITEGGVTKFIEFDNIVYPEQINHTRYSVVALLDSGNLELLGANALLNFTNEVFVSENHIFVTRNYIEKSRDGDTYKEEDMTDIAVLGYTADTLTDKGIITLKGQALDQYFFDEYEGHLRAVTSTASITYKNALVNPANEKVMINSERRLSESASLYVIDLSDNSIVGAVENFAPEGDEAVSVRFDKDSAYVCTAVVITFVDPVYFFDLSDHENITYTDTGVISGFSSSLINLGEGFLLGIGEENLSVNKVEIYEEQDDAVVSVDRFYFVGSYPIEYKAYLIDRENDLFGFAIRHLLVVENPDDRFDRYDEWFESCYLLLHFDGYKLTPMIFDFSNPDELSNPIFASAMTQPNYVRAKIHEGYLYIVCHEIIAIKLPGAPAQEN